MTDERRPTIDPQSPSARRRSEGEDPPWFDDSFVAFESDTEEVPWDRPTDEGWFDPDEDLMVSDPGNDGPELAPGAGPSPAYPAPTAAPYAIGRIDEPVDVEAVIALDPEEEFAPVSDEPRAAVTSPAALRRSSSADTLFGREFAPPSRERPSTATHNQFDPPLWSSVAMVASPWAGGHGIAPGQLELGSVVSRSQPADANRGSATAKEGEERASRAAKITTLVWTLIVGAVVVGLVLAFLQFMTGVFR